MRAVTEQKQGIVLPPYDFSTTDHVAALREGLIRRINSLSLKTHREFGQYDFRDGLYGEIAFAGWSGIGRKVAQLGSLTDGGFDFLDGKLRIDVKATASRGTWAGGRAHLLRPSSAGLRSDVFVLIVLNEDRQKARFAGWATRAELEGAPVRTPEHEGRPKVYVPTRVLTEAALHADWKGWA